ncbi:MAG: cation:H+ antiporter [Roseibaca calidilacus]|uniref:Cation:H+ antiporter n=1 Tax=Roseibaca calidilacus TaxID=1666912 RepID=A0A0P7YY18_9RHOB|nr:calcium/sodium antiporter [Roseibaca calidilacus]KPP93983.1 MAG: cation:H+ antiporter [Roseibaca calidilacus]CUX79471.1 cation:H+ antiporter [Roseibaca calidilacus]
MDWVLVCLGLLALLLGGEGLVRGAVAIAHRFAMPPLLIGLTVVGFGTSMPELLVSADAAWRGVPDIAIGNVVGSNIGNILLILGVTALVWPVHVAGRSVRRDLAVMVLAAIALVPLFWLAEVGRLAGAALFLGLIAYLVWAYLNPQGAALDTEHTPAQPLWQALGWLVAGLCALMLGARLLVDGAVSIAHALGLSEAFIGLTIVAVGTSLPELATSVMAARRKQSAIAIGNIVGSNIFNVLGILGITALIAPIPVADRFLRFDLPVMIAASVVLALMLLMREGLGRRAGAVLLLAYAGFVWAAQG